MYDVYGSWFCENEECDNSATGPKVTIEITKAPYTMEQSLMITAMAIKFVNAHKHTYDWMKHNESHKESCKEFLALCEEVLEHDAQRNSPES